MSNAKSAKGNPASKRMSNPNLKARRKRSWEAAQKRKDANRKANEQRHRDNLARIANGELTPWQARKAARKARRDTLRSEGKLPPIGTTRTD